MSSILPRLRLLAGASDDFVRSAADHMFASRKDEAR